VIGYWQQHYELYKVTIAKIRETGWHWFAYHFRSWPPHPFAASLLAASASLDERVPGLGKQLLLEIASLGGREKHRPDYDQLIQKLAEVMVLARLLELPWPKGSCFQREPAVLGGKRPELLVKSNLGDFLFEVKAPALLEHAQRRSSNGAQLPARVISLKNANSLFGADNITLPRDNPVKDFLISADAKFRPFKTSGDAIGILVIVWDDFIYEPITALVHEHSGLLTTNSFARDGNDRPLTFPNVDAVILIRHLSYFCRAAGDQPLIERTHAFDFGDSNALPNVYIPVAGGKCLSGFVREGLRAWPLDHPFLQTAAEYRPQDIVMWFDN
jgi:hypothetical protein